MTIPDMLLQKEVMQVKRFLSGMGFEPMPSIEDQKSRSRPGSKVLNLESGALDHSAILT